MSVKLSDKEHLLAANRLAKAASHFLQDEIRKLGVGGGEGRQLLLSTGEALFSVLCMREALEYGPPQSEEGLQIIATFYDTSFQDTAKRWETLTAEALEGVRKAREAGKSPAPSVQYMEAKPDART